MPANRGRNAPSAFSLALGLLTYVAAPFDVSAQAWLPPKGELSISSLYQNVFIREHAASNGALSDVGHIWSSTALMDVTYGVTDNFAVRIGIPFVEAKYKGPTPHKNPTNPLIDYGAYHGGFQDFNINLRYNIRRRPLVITPFFTAIIPSHNYQYFAHSAIGRDLREFRMGVNLARRLDPFLRKAYVQGSYSYGFVEQVLNTSHNQSNADFEIGYFLTRRLAVSALGIFQYTHGGMDYLYNVFPKNLTTIQFQHHDQLGRVVLFDPGVSAAYEINKSLYVFGSFLTKVYAVNGHALSRGLTVGMTWTRSPKEMIIGRVVDGKPALLADASDRTDSGDAPGEHLARRCSCRPR